MAPDAIKLDNVKRQGYVHVLEDNSHNSVKIDNTENIELIVNNIQTSVIHHHVLREQYQKFIEFDMKPLIMRVASDTKEPNRLVHVKKKEPNRGFLNLLFGKRSNVGNKRKDFQLIDKFDNCSFIFAYVDKNFKMLSRQK
ncbi:hypothetical protein LOAG_15742 [Loa loa]|uniref:Uncharacterized protein n=1 Tax=Loa loa TaxID=7209 RepID=A0A1S0TG97_LOALO|nr:hypothetical protein LOAG_15742 [Loa loa]EFO12791.1 hypothetical protein LOAG_15742 [Loa loa]